MDYLMVALLTGLGLASVVGAYSAGWISGWDKSEANHRWSRWLLRHHSNRSTRI